MGASPLPPFHFCLNFTRLSCWLYIENFRVQIYSVHGQVSRCVPTCAGITISFHYSQKTASSLRPPEWTKCRLCRKLKMNTYFLETGYGTMFCFYCVTKILVFITHDLFVLLANTSLLLIYKLLKLLWCVWSDDRICLPLEWTRPVLVQLRYEAYPNSCPSQIEPKSMKNMKVLFQEEV